MKLGERIRELRHQKGETLLELGDGAGLSVSYLSDLERGRTSPSMQTLQALADHFELTVTDFLAGVDFAGEKTPLSLPRGLVELSEDRDLLETLGGELDEEWIRLLAGIDLRGQRPKSKSEWLELYLSLKRILERA
ncbi:MAG: helix-turn-helix transcriptional regulator [Anaerolineales bacterium]|nr:helix-turn-helix transcriptional regulator [Anaerolineales bacterium]